MTNICYQTHTRWSHYIKQSSTLLPPLIKCHRLHCRPLSYCTAQQQQQQKQQKNSSATALPCNRTVYSWPRDKRNLKKMSPLPGQTLEGAALFGLFPVLMALKAERRQFYRLFIKDSMADNPKDTVREVMEVCKERGIPMTECKRNLLDKLSESRTNQGLIMDASPLQFLSVNILSDEDFSDKKSFDLDGKGGNKRVWLIVDGIKDPMNFGAVLRSSYFLGVERVFVTRPNSCGLTGIVSKASAGAMEVIPVYGLRDQPEFIERCRRTGWRVFSTGAMSSGDDQEDINTEVCNKGRWPNRTKLLEVETASKMVLIIGSEGTGLPEHMTSLCHQTILIPSANQLNRHLDSLNLSVATGIILHHLMNS